MKKIVLYGAGGLARELVLLIDSINSVFPNTYEFLGYVVDEKYYIKGKIVDGYPILGTKKWLLDNKNEVVCTCAFANVHEKQRIQEELSCKGVVFESLISPTVKIPKTSTIGPGCVIGVYCLVSTGVHFGPGVFLNSGVSIGHDVIIDGYSSVMPYSSISGFCHVGENVLIGAHSFIVEHKKIGDKAVVAAGSIVFSNVKAGTTVLGNPAKRMRAIED